MTDKDKVKELLDYLSIPHEEGETDLTIRVVDSIEKEYQFKSAILQELAEKKNPQVVVGYTGFEARFCFDSNNKFVHISITE